MPRSSENKLVRMVNISKTFNHVNALKGVDFEVGSNEIVGLLGDNGAGKSTLIKTLTGVHEPDTGKIYWKGKKLENYSVAGLRKLGIETVYQDNALCGQQALWENVFMGRELTDKFGVIDIEKEKSETGRLMKEMGFTKDTLVPDATLKNLSGGEKQGVAISRSLYFDADLIILDEPTSDLSLTEAQKVLDFINKIKKAGKSCIIISHNVHHVYPVAERIVVLEQGEVKGDFAKEDLTLEELSSQLRTIAETGNRA